MNKKFYTSKTFWGVVLLGLETMLRGYALNAPFNLDPVILAFGIVLTGYGFRDAMK